MSSRDQYIRNNKYLSRNFILCMVVNIFMIIISNINLHAQYPYIIEMSDYMIGNAAIIAKQEVVHLPGFEAKAGLEYSASIDPNFSGSGSTYEPPITPSIQNVSASDMNYIITTTPLVAGYVPGNTYYCNQINTDITYFDGLGRQIQNVAVMASPGQNDMITPFSYDFAGRSDTSFLTFELARQSGQFDSSYATDQKAFIESNYGNSNKNYGFSLPFYEPSPLNRILKQSAPGSDWAFKPNAPNDEHVIEYEHAVNETDVAGWKTENNSFASITYAPGQLFVVVTKNENKGINRTVIKEYKNKNDQLVLKEQITGGTSLKTYYIYDEFDLLRCVVPPKASGPSDNELCFYYTYDKKHRMVAKKVPGADSVLMVYDKRDRLVMSQDGNMLNTNARQWLLTCYDTYDRPVMSGVYIHNTSLSRVQMQDHYDSNVTILNEEINGNFNNTDHGYSRNVISALSASGNSYDILSVSWYDNYSFATGYGFDETNGIVGINEVIFPKGTVTGTKVRVIEDGSYFKSWMIRATYYDNKYRIVQTVSDNQLPNGMDIISNRYTFDGKLQTKKTKHTAFSQTFEYTEDFVYDHRGRLLEHTIDGLPEQQKVMVTSMHYNPAGQLSTTQVHSPVSGTSHAPFLQKINYTYNIRGWLSAINNPDEIGAENDIFALKLHYHDAVNNVTGQVQYNGNISAAEWTTNKLNRKNAYRYDYDVMNRITAGYFYDWNGGGYSHDGSFDEKSITYDANGNILSLSRVGAGNQQIDQLTYHYLNNANQISYITDPMLDVADINDYPGVIATSQGFWYDKNGNMILMVDKGINEPIKYSLFNKPVEIDFGTGEKINYFYDGVGNKLAKIVKDNDALPESSLLYAGNFVYNLNGDLQYIITDEGRLVACDDHFRFEYFMKDHLGNTRATYAQAAPGVPQVSEYLHYYPFGMQLENLCYTSGADLPNNYLFNGKELQPDYDLQWYDYGARFYDPQLGRWHSVDPMADLFRSWSPYIYCLDDPLRFIDPDGMIPGDPVKNPQIRENRASNLFGKVRAKEGVPNIQNHQGFDYAAPSGTDVLAVEDGKVIAIQTKDEGDYGKSVTIEITDAEGNTRYAFYAHLESVSVTVGQKVSEGDVVGKSGTSGNTDKTPPHLHFENRTEKAPGKGLPGRENPNKIVDTDFTSQDPNATQTTTGVKKTVTNADGTTTTTNMDVTTTTTTAPTETSSTPPTPNTNDDHNRL